MRSVVILMVLAIGAGAFASVGLDAISRIAQKPVKPVIEPKSVAYYCAKSIPKVWQYARDSGEDVDSIKGKIGYTLFEEMATRVCICMQDQFDEQRSSGEKALYGKFAGYRLIMDFSSIYSNEVRETIKKNEAQPIARKHRSILKKKPKWLNRLNKEYKICKKENQIDKKFSFSGF